MDVGNRAARSQLNSFVVLSGTANSGCIGPALGAFDIGESVGSYLFRVALPGVTKGEIDARMVTSTYLPGGILEVTVGKRVFPDTSPKMAGIKRPNPYL
ncbi:hypothetical protein Ddye_007477 [Dipteronia dyeriana]|uniref:Uncharacterized protein n=1 Tax=Dipteronia dyeriana TaxID=168575 RepID=A0AAD9XK06_9ROSI|nr:hypothetical protein Ddye_007477 [Dipteronia dyeriana]